MKSNPLKLVGFQDARRTYEFDGAVLMPLAGEFEPIEAQVGAAGYASFIRRLASPWSMTPVMLYVLADSLILRIGSSTVRLGDTGLTISRRTILPCLKRIAIRTGAQEVLSEIYFSCDSIFEDGGFHYHDILLYVAEHITGSANRERFIFLWTGLANGRSLRDSTFRQELEAIAAGSSAGK